MILCGFYPITDELDEYEYDHRIEMEIDALNKQYNEYEKAKNAEIEALKASLEERESLIAASFETVKLNADLVLTKEQVKLRI